MTLMIGGLAGVWQARSVTEHEQMRHDWRIEEIEALLALPFSDLLYRAHRVHRAHHDPNRVQISTLLSIKTGACPEDCAYCPQSAHHRTGVTLEPLLSVAEVERAARAAGVTRFCLGAAWRNPSDRHLDRVVPMLRALHELGLESCATLGMLTQAQARRLKDAGLDYYNHNLDTSPEYYTRIITTRRYEDRLATLAHVRAAGIGVCCGGIIGMGETRRDRCRLLQQLANMPLHPESVPINLLVQVPGTPLHGTPPLDPLEFVRTVAAARVILPRSMVRLSAGRTAMSDELQAWCFFAGANSIFHGDRLLTTGNPRRDADRALLARLGMQTQARGARQTGRNSGESSP